MCEYRAAHCKYAGDKELRAATKVPRRKRGPTREPQEVDDGTMRVNWTQYLEAKRPPHRALSRLCDHNPELLKKHLRSFERKHKGLCNVCKAETYSKCMICGLHCCFKDGNNMSSVSCSMDLHSDKYFGLLKCDRKGIFGETGSSYKKPSRTEVNKNGRHIKQYQDRYYEEYIKG